MKTRPPDQSNKERGSSSKSGVAEAERRSVQRKPFVADAHIVDINSGDKLSCRSCDLVISGCYVDALNPLPAGRVAHIQLRQGKTIFESDANVVYSIPGMGMGIAFTKVTPENERILKEWLSGATPTENVCEIPVPESKSDDTEHVLRQPTGQFVELVLILIKKGILTTSEAARLLTTPPAK